MVALFKKRYSRSKMQTVHCAVDYRVGNFTEGKYVFDVVKTHILGNTEVFAHVAQAFRIWVNRRNHLHLFEVVHAFVAVHRGSVAATHN